MLNSMYVQGILALIFVGIIFIATEEKSFLAQFGTKICGSHERFLFVLVLISSIFASLILYFK